MPPDLDKRRRRREQQELYADSADQERQDSPGRIGLSANGLPLGRWLDRQQSNGDHDKTNMQHILSFLRKVLGRQMGVTVAGKQGNLKEEHARRPHRWAPTEPGEDRLANQRLYLKQEKRAKKDRAAEDERK
jgi:hypothetical protein